MSRAHNSSRYATIFERLRETKFNAIVDNIDEAGDKRTFVNRKGETVEASGDWRAKAWIAERLIAPERCGQQVGNTTVNQTAVIVQAGGEDQLRRMIEHYAGMAAKQLPCQTQGQIAGQISGSGTV
jgi:hypothetical protein